MDWTIRYGGGHEGHLALNPLGLAGGQEEWCWAGTGRNLFTCTVEYSLAAALDKLLRPPFFDRQLQGTKAPLHPTEADGQAVFKREVLRMVREHRSVHAPYIKGNFQFERTVTGWRTRYPLLDFRLKW